MFYVTNISGGLVPFDPKTTPISTTASATVSATEAVDAAAVAATVATEELITAGDISPTDTTTQASIAQSSEAVVYESTSAAPGRATSGVIDTTNIGRAGAAMAYRTQGAEFSSETPPTAPGATIESVQVAKIVDNESEDSPHRVNPVRREGYRQPPHTKERKRVVVARDIMSSPVFSLKEYLPLESAQSVFRAHKYRHIPILSADSKLVGIISDRDFIRPISQAESKTTQIRARMITNILTARPETEVRAIAEVMMAHHIGCLPITEESGKLVGILTRSDILRAIVNNAPIELWT